MSTLSFGLSSAKKKNPLPSKPVVRNPPFGDDDDEDGGNEPNDATEIGTIGGVGVPETTVPEGPKSRKNVPKEAPRGKPKSAHGISLYGDLSSRASSLKHVSEA